MKQDLVQRSLENLGINCIITRPADVSKSNKERKRKTDKIDSRKIVRGLRAKGVYAIYVLSIQQEADRGTLKVKK